MNKCFRSYPVLSLRKVPSMSITLPSAKTASIPARYGKIYFSAEQLLTKELLRTRSLKLTMTKFLAALKYFRSQNKNS